MKYFARFLGSAVIFSGFLSAAPDASQQNVLSAIFSPPDPKPMEKFGDFRQNFLSEASFGNYNTFLQGTYRIVDSKHAVDDKLRTEKVRRNSASFRVGYGVRAFVTPAFDLAAHGLFGSDGLGFGVDTIYKFMPDVNFFIGLDFMHIFRFGGFTFDTIFAVRNANYENGHQRRAIKIGVAFGGERLVKIGYENVFTTFRRVEGPRPATGSGSGSSGSGHSQEIYRLTTVKGWGHRLMLGFSF